MFYSKFIKTGDPATRIELNNKNAKNLDLWEDIHKAFITETELYNNLISDDSKFDEIDPSHIMQHSLSKLQDFWKEVNLKYKKALTAYTMSGTNNSDFYDYCNDLNTYYLHKWLLIKPDATNFVKGGFFDEDCFDSSESTNNIKKNRESPRAEAMKNLTSSIQKLTELQNTDEDEKQLRKDLLKQNNEEKKLKTKLL